MNYYNLGYKNGRNDRFLGKTMSEVALTSHLEGYTKGYIDGWYSAKSID